jgi:serine/threonine protein kinase
MMTNAGTVVGTPAFMPPELATGEPCDARSDLYSLGVMLYLMGSGRLPFMSDSVHELLALHASDEAAPPMTGVPPRLAGVIDKLLAKRPADRYQSAALARTALEESLILSTPQPSGDVGDTHPSIGPFPATTAQFAGMQTPLPPSLIAEQTGRKKPSKTAVDRLMTGETMLAANGAPATAVASQPGVPSAPSSAALPSMSVSSVPAARKRWPLFAGAGVVAAASVVAIAMAMSGSKAPEPTPAPPGPPAKQVIVEPPPPVPEPASAKPLLGADDGSAKTADPPIKPEPPTSKVGSKPPRVKPPRTGTRPPKVPITTAGSAEVKITPPPVIPNAGPNAGSNTKPAGTGSGTKPVPTPF